MSSIEKEKPYDVKTAFPEVIQPTIRELEGGRRRMELQVGQINLVIDDIPSDQMTTREWYLIQIARESYTNMWGGNHYQRVEHDPFDFPDKNSPIKTTHQIATAKLPEETIPKIYTNRTIHVPGYVLEQKEVEVPDDISFWNIVHEKTGKVESFRELLSGKVSSDSIITVISRSGTFPISTTEKSEVHKEKAGISFASVQFLATTPKTEFIVCQLCDEFPSKVLNISTDSESVELNFTRTEQIFSTSQDPIKTTLNLLNPDARAHQLKFPGYWVDNDKARNYLFSLFEKGLLKPEDLAAPFRELYVGATEQRDGEKTFAQLSKLGLVESKSGVPIYLEAALSASEKKNQSINLLNLLSSSRYLKYLIPLINSEENINENLTGEEFREGFIHNSGVGPFSSTLAPKSWLKTNLNLLIAAKNKYSNS